MSRPLRFAAEAFARALAALLPRGYAWPRERGSLLFRLLEAFGTAWEWVGSRDADLLEREAYPGTSLELLPDWERVAGLPDPCFPTGGTLEERRLAVETKLAARGGASRAYFIDLAARLGYAIAIIEYSPFMAGWSRAGDPRWQVGSPAIRFVWRVTVPGARLSWFRAGQGRAGRDPHCRIGRAVDLECLFRRLKPAHTDLIFDYSGA